MRAFVVLGLVFAVPSHWLGDCVRFSFLHTKPRDWLGNVFEMTYFVSSGT